MTDFLEIGYLTDNKAQPLFTQDHKKRLLYASEQGIKPLIPLMPHTGKCAIVGSSPTIAESLDKIREIKNSQFGIVISINGAHKYLIDNGIIPNIHIIFEVDLKSALESTGGPLHKDVIYYICSHMCKGIFEETKGYKRILWHCYLDLPYYQEYIKNIFPNQVLVAGNYCSFFRSLTIAQILGFSDFEIFGCDASLLDDKIYFEGYHNDSEQPKLVVNAGTKEVHRQFTTTPFLSYQTHQFLLFCDMNRDLKIRVHGDGLMKYLHQMEFPKQYERLI